MNLNNRGSKCHNYCADSTTDDCFFRLAIVALFSVGLVGTDNFPKISR